MSDYLGPYLLGPNDTPENGIYTGDARELAKAIPDESVDLIFTDPPWSSDDLHLYVALANLSQRVLKPGGFLFAYTGNDWLPYIMRSMAGAGLCWFRMFAGVQLNSDDRCFRKRLFVKWRPIIVYSKGDSNHKGWLPDALHTKRDKRFHPWGQGIAPILRWIRNATEPNAVVVDPYVGGGTVPAVCKMLGRRYLAFEIDPDVAEVARERVRMTQMPLFVLEPEQGEMVLGET